MGFRFRLESVLVLRRTVEAERAAECARAVAGVHAAERARQAIVMRRDAARAQLLGGFGACTAAARHAARAYLCRLDAEIAAAQRDAAGAAAVADGAQGALRAAATDRMRLEILQERRYDEFLRAAAAAEERESPLTLPVSPADDYTNAAAASSWHGGRNVPERGLRAGLREYAEDHGGKASSHRR